MRQARQPREKPAAETGKVAPRVMTMTELGAIRAIAARQATSSLRAASKHVATLSREQRKVRLPCSAHPNGSPAGLCTLKRSGGRL